MHVVFTKCRGKEVEEMRGWNISGERVSVPVSVSSLSLFHRISRLEWKEGVRRGGIEISMHNVEGTWNFALTPNISICSPTVDTPSVAFLFPAAPGVGRCSFQDGEPGVEDWAWGFCCLPLPDISIKLGVVRLKEATGLLLTVLRAGEKWLAVKGVRWLLLCCVLRWSKIFVPALFVWAFFVALDFMHVWSGGKGSTMSGRCIFELAIRSCVKILIL